MPQLHSTTFDSGQAQINVAVGPETGPPLVLLHGVTRRWQDFVPILPSLLLQWQIHAIDLRGHGGSGRAPGGYQVIDYAGDVVAYLRGELERPAVVMGHSLGGMVAAAVAALAPDAVRAVVMEDPPFETMGAHIQDTIYPQLFSVYRDKGIAGSRQPAEELAPLLADIPILRAGETVPVTLGSLRDATALRFQASCLRHLDPEVLDPVIAGDWLKGYEVENILKRIVCPSLLLQGEFALGGLLPDEYAEHVVSRLAKGILVRFSGVGHQIHWEQSAEMMRYVNGFLASLD